MTFLVLKPHVSFGLVGGHAVFLDLRQDRYLALDIATEAAFARLRSASAPVMPDGEDGERLLSTGLFRSAESVDRLSAASVLIPDHSLLTGLPSQAFRLTASFKAWANVARARKRLRTLPLIELVGRVRQTRGSAEAAGTLDDAEKEAAAYLAARALVPVDRSCLLDCLGLVDWLGARARHVSLVFGVRMDPFGAHCWLQTERAILTDAPDTVRNFVPVLVV